MDFNWHADKKIGGNLSAEQQATILALHDTPHGQMVNVPADFYRIARREFEEEANASAGSKLAYAGNTLFFPFLLTTLNSVNVIKPTATMVVTEIIFCTLMSALLGNTYLKSKANRIDFYQSRYDERTSYYLDRVRKAADTAIRTNFVRDTDAVVRAGGSISRSTLAKLVNVDDHFFQNACDRLNVTVLQAKILLAMGKGQVKELNIASYNSLPFADISHQITSRAERGDERMLLNVLRDQFAEVQRAIAESKAVSDTSPIETPTTKEAKSWGLTPVLNWFAKGLKGNLDVFRKVSAGDHLPKVPKSIFIPEIPEAEGLGKMITHYNTEKLSVSNAYNLDHLDLPALTSWTPRVI